MWMIVALIITDVGAFVRLSLVQHGERAHLNLKRSLEV